MIVFANVLNFTKYVVHETGTATGVSAINMIEAAVQMVALAIFAFLTVFEINRFYNALPILPILPI